MEIHKFQKKQFIGAAVSILLTLSAVFSLYSREFTVDVLETALLEEEIKAYNFTTGIDVEVLECENVGRYLYVLYAQKEYDGYGGIARLEKGILGKYRFLSCNNFDWPLYHADGEEIGGENYLFLYGLNTLPQVETFRVYDNFEKQGEPVYIGKAMEAPFLEVIRTEELLQPMPWCIRYFDADGEEVPENELWEMFPVAAGGSGSSVGTAETGMVYVLIGIVLLLGLICARFFLMEDPGAKAEEK